MTLRADLRLSLGSFRLEAELGADPGEVVGVLGPNGAGKTTLLRAIAGLVTPEEGRIGLGGRTLVDTDRGVSTPPARREVGMVFQDYLLFPHLSTLDNVAFGLRARGVPTSEARRRALGWLEQMGIGEMAGARPRALSGGQAQRVALARALALEPRLLLLDEPLSALDVESRHRVRADLVRHLSGFEGPSLLVTHDPLDAIVLSDRLVILEGGRVTQTGRVEEVTRRPRSEWVARLVGVNLYRGRGEGDRVRLEDGGSLVVADRTEGDVLVLIHPEAVALHRERPGGSPRNAWQGRVTALEPVGRRVRVQVEGPVPVVAEVTRAAVADLGLAGAAPVWVAIKATEVEVYPG